MTPGLTTEEIRAYAREYLELPHGHKGERLRGRPFTEWQMRRWRAALLDGNVEWGLALRGAASPAGGRRAAAAERALDDECGYHARELEEMRIAHAVDLARRDERIRVLEEGTAALGKAFGPLRRLREREPDDRSRPTSAG